MATYMKRMGWVLSRTAVRYRLAADLFLGTLFCIALVWVPSAALLSLSDEMGDFRYGVAAVRVPLFILGVIALPVALLAPMHAIAIWAAFLLACTACAAMLFLAPFAVAWILAGPFACAWLFSTLSPVQVSLMRQGEGRPAAAFMSLRWSLTGLLALLSWWDGSWTPALGDTASPFILLLCGLWIVVGLWVLSAVRCRAKEGEPSCDVLGVNHLPP